MVQANHAPAFENSYSGDIRRFAVSCDQWARTRAYERPLLDGKFEIPDYASVYKYSPVQVIGMDFVNTDRNRYSFLLFCPELVIVKETHGRARWGPKHQSGPSPCTNVAKDFHWCMIFPTATLYSGIAAAFQSLLGILRPELETGVMESLSDAYLRQAMREAQGDLRLVPAFPPDLLGVLVLQPLVAL